MAAFVLIHGMWHGGWCWEKVTALLREAGHEVYVPTLTGLAERASLRNDNLDLNTHIQEVVDLIESENLHNVILVGHSLGGFMAPVVADKTPERIAHIVNLDGPMPVSGTALKDLIGDTWHFFKQRATECGDEWWCPPITEWTFGISGTELESVQSKLTPHPLRTLTTIVTLENPRLKSIPVTFILCSEGLSDTEVATEEKNFTDLGMNFRSLPTGHDAMITMPDNLTEILLELSRENR
jgi:pimeloyl-ACP methyl ester carboxylesterase